MKAKIQEDLKTAMKAREQLAVTTLRGLVSEIKNAEIDTRAEVSEEKIIGIIQKEIKKRTEANQFAETAGRADMIEQNNKEIEILQKYLGAQMSDEELQSVIKEMIGQGKNQIGAIMGGLNQSYKGRFDGRKASELIKTLLQ